MRTLYLSYDGMTDPLGRSQVIPYLKGLAAKGHSITLVSCEKPARFENARSQVSQILNEAGIEWHPLTYHKRPPILSTIWDLRQMQKAAEQIAEKKRIELVHCRSYIPALAGLRLKRKRGIRLIFDMRGFWADERVDGGLWNLRKPHYRLVYDYFKRKEKHLLNEADRVVSLTRAGKHEMLKWGIGSDLEARIEVIPCCADLDHFRADRVSEVDRARWRTALGLSAEDEVISYLGSIGTWYLLEEMLRFFKLYQKSNPRGCLLFITPDDPSAIRNCAAKIGLDEKCIRIREAGRNEVPGLLSLSRLGLFFIRPSYSKISSSPTKLAEYLSMGIPVVTNAGVGDSDWIASHYKVQQVVSGFSDHDFERTIHQLPELLRLAPEEIRSVAQSCFSLKDGVEAYHRMYTALENG